MTHGKLLLYLLFAVCAAAAPALAAADPFPIPMVPVTDTRIDSVLVSVNGEP